MATLPDRNGKADQNHPLSQPAHLRIKFRPGTRQATRSSSTRGTRHLSNYLLDLLAVGAVYFVLAKIGLTLASINSSTSAIWPATGFALAAVLMWGYRVAIAILIASFAANLTNVGSI